MMAKGGGGGLCAQGRPDGRPAGPASPEVPKAMGGGWTKPPPLPGTSGVGRRPGPARACRTSRAWAQSRAHRLRASISRAPAAARRLASIRSRNPDQSEPRQDIKPRTPTTNHAEDPPRPRRRQEAPLLFDRGGRQPLAPRRRPLHREGGQLHNPLLKKDDAQRLILKGERITEWLGKGAQPTERVARFLSTQGLAKWEHGTNLKKGEPHAKAKERVKEREERAAALAAAPHCPSRCFEPEAVAEAPRRGRCRRLAATAEAAPEETAPEAAPGSRSAELASHRRCPQSNPKRPSEEGPPSESLSPKRRPPAEAAQREARSL